MGADEVVEFDACIIGRSREIHDKLNLSLAFAK